MSRFTEYKLWDGKIPPEVIEKIYEGEAWVKTIEKLSEEFGKTLDAYRNGKIDEGQFKNIQESISKYFPKFKKLKKVRHP